MTILLLTFLTRGAGETVNPRTRCHHGLLAVSTLRRGRPCRHANSECLGVIMGSIKRGITAELTLLLTGGFAALVFGIILFARPQGFPLSHPKAVMLMALMAVGLWCSLRAWWGMRHPGGGTFASNKTLPNRLAKWNLLGILLMTSLVVLSKLFQVDWLARFAAPGLVGAFLCVPLTLAACVVVMLVNLVRRGKVVSSANIGAGSDDSDDS